VDPTLSKQTQASRRERLLCIRRGEGRRRIVAERAKWKNGDSLE
jgi:hypothetical protein